MIEKLNIKKAIEETGIGDETVGGDIYRDLNIIWDVVCAISNKVDEIVDVVNKQVYQP